MEISHFQNFLQEATVAWWICVVAGICRMYHVKWRLPRHAVGVRGGEGCLLCHGTLENEMIFRWRDRWLAWDRQRLRGRGERREAMWRRRGETTWTPEEARSYWCYCVTAKRGNPSFLIGCRGRGEAPEAQTVPQLTAQAPAIITNLCLTWKVWTT